jgi:hypothetical protein
MASPQEDRVNQIDEVLRIKEVRETQVRSSDKVN